MVWCPLLLCVVAAIALAGCGSTRWTPAADGRAGEAGRQPITGPTYRVKAGDTLEVIAARAGLDSRRIVEWNQLRSPDRIYVGQVLRLTAPGEARTVARAPSDAGEGARNGPAATASVTARTDARRPPPADTLRWQWPTAGRVVERFAAGDAVRKGVKIAGKAGQPILAAEGGEVVYSGSGLVGYGPLIIVQHNKNYLSAYGHNRKLLVRQGDQVTKGAQIAEMGLAGGRPLLHFEIRRDGDPVDPTALLPRR
jgi:lipoprotein NlpD